MDIAEFEFEPIVEKGPGSTRRELFLLTRCPARVVREDVIVLGTYDMHYCADRADEYVLAYDQYRTMFDRKSETLTAVLEGGDVRVRDVRLLSAGHVVIDMGGGLRLDVVPMTGGPVEAWRLMIKGGDHHVYPPDED